VQGLFIVNEEFAPGKSKSRKKEEKHRSDLQREMTKK
jgi:hypothetical protein